MAAADGVPERDQLLGAHASMTQLALKDLLRIEEPRRFKIHFARWNGQNHPLHVFARSRDDWRGWQEFWPKRNDFNRQYIFAVMDFVGEDDTWLFGGVYEVIGLVPEGPNWQRYEVRLTDIGKPLIGRLKIGLRWRGRTTRMNLERHYNAMTVKELLPEPYSGAKWPGFGNLVLPIREVQQLPEGWRAPLASVGGVYLIVTADGEQYVGSDYGAGGFLGRWRAYAETGHAGNVKLRRRVEAVRNGQVAILEVMDATTPSEEVIAEETLWKRKLGSRAHGLNAN